MRLIRRLGGIERIFGWHSREVVGKRVEEFRPLYQDEEARAAFSGNRNYRKDGSVAADLELANEKLRLVPFRLIEVRENERKRLAGELHDSIGQTLAALKFRIKHVIATLKKRQSKQAPQLLHELIPIPRRSIDETGTIRMGLKPIYIQRGADDEKNAKTRRLVRCFRSLGPGRFSFAEDMELSKIASRSDWLLH